MSKVPDTSNQQESSSEPIGVGGLSQEELDSLAVCTEEDHKFERQESSEAFLLRVRRARHFLGDEAANALVLDAMSEVPNVACQDKDAMETTSTASGSMSTASGTTGLGSMSLTVELAKAKMARKQGSGFSQEELDALSLGVNEEQPERTISQSSLVVNEEPGAETEKPVSPSKVPQKMQSKFGGLCIDLESDDVDDISPRVMRVASPQRKFGNSIYLPTSPAKV
jgi:hypothetical protein